MSAEDTARALMALSDVAVRHDVARGDLTGLGDLELTKAEVRIVFHAASDGAASDGVLGDGDGGDVEGFGSPTMFAPPYVPVGPVVSGMGAIRYVEDNLAHDSPIRGEFNDWATKFAQGSW